MKTSLLHLVNLLVFLSLQPALIAQPDYHWASALGGISSDVCHGVAYGINGNVYAVGQFQGIVNLNTVSGPVNITSFGNSDGYVIAYNPEGEILWVKRIGGSDLDGAKAVDVDNDGNVYVTGFFRGSVNFGTVDNPLILEAPGIFSASDIFLAKYSPTGDLVWAHNFGSDANDEGRDIKIGYDGNIYFCGSFGSFANFNTSGGEDLIFATNNGADIFMAKFTTDGALIWARAMGGTATNRANSIDVDTDNNVYLTGQFEGTADFDPSLFSTSFTATFINLFVAKYNSNGQLIWVHGVGGSGFDIGTAIAVDIEGNAYITGNFWGTIDFDSGEGEMLVTSNSESDIFLAKYSPTGECLWAFGIGGNASDEGRGVAVDLAGNVYITGAFAQTVDFDPSTNTNNLVSNGFFDIYVAKYNPQGEYQWAFVVGGTSSCYGNTVAHDYGNKLAVGGNFAVFADFDPSENEAIINSFNPAFDAFVVQYESCNSPTQFFAETICAGDVFVFGETEITEAGYHWQIENNEAGCDSFITLQLEVIEINAGINLFENTLFAVQVNAEYQWYECSATLVLIEGETGQTFSPMQSGSYQVAVNIGGCEEISNCIPLVITDVKDHSSPKFSIFPNPAKDQFWINYTGETPATALLLNIQGQMVMPPVNLQPGAATMIQHTLAPGLYLLQLNYLEEMKVVKVVVE